MNDSTKRRVLLVEHDYDLCEILKSLLEEDGFSVDLAFSTFDALSKLGLAQIIITETKLLGIDHEMITKTAAFDGIPVIYFTADLDFDGPASHTLHKPTSVRELVGLMDRLAPR